MARRELKHDFTADDHLSGTLKGIGREADKAADKLDDTAKATKGLDEQVARTTKTIADLRREIAETGDTSLFGSLAKNESELRKLTKLKETFRQVGDESAEEFGLSFSQRIGPLMARMPIGPQVVAAIGAAAPAAVAVLGAAISGGVAVAGVGAGVALAARSPEVKAAASDLSSFIGRELQFAARPFVPATLDAIATVRQGFADLRPEFEGIFADAAPFLQTLTQGAVGGLQALVPALRDVMHNADPVVDVIGDHLAKAADAAGISLRLMSQDSQYTAQQLDQLLSSVEGVIVGIGGLVALVNKLGEAQGKADGFIEKLGPVGDAIKRIVNPIGSAIGALGDLGRLLGVDADEAEKVPPAVDAAAASMLDANTAARIAAAGTALYTEWLNKQNQAYENSINDAISAERATLRFAEATNTAKGAVDRKKGASVAERGALLSMIEAANTATTANEKQGISSAEAARKHKTQRDALIAVATKMFGSRDAAIAYVDKLLKIPASRRTEITAANAQALGAIAAVNTGLAKIDGKTVTTYIKVRTIGGTDRVTSSTGGGREVDDPSRRRRAAGGPVAAGLTYLVGEEGPELLRVPADGFVVPAGETRRVMSGARSAPSTPRGLGGLTYNDLVRALQTVPLVRIDAGKAANIMSRTG